MSKKHGRIGLITLGAAAVAGAVTALAVQQIRKNREEALERREDAIFLDLDGDGEADVVMEDRDGDGQIDTVTTDTTGDGQPDTTMLDLTGDGDVDVVITGNPEVLKALRDTGMEISTQESEEAAPTQE